jgi:hypothetical protein
MVAIAPSALILDDVTWATVRLFRERVRAIMQR